MDLGYSLDEILEIAEQIERNGAAFYRAAAGVVAEAATRESLLTLAADEDVHEQTFASMRRELAGAASAGVGDPDGVVAGYLRAVAGRCVFNKAQPAGDALKGTESVKEILDLAIGREEDSIALYVGFRDALASVEDQDKVGRIIREEQKHLTLLCEESEKL